MRVRTVPQPRHVRDDVDGRAGVHLSDRHDRRHERIHAARNVGVEGGRDVDESSNRIVGQVRRRTMPTRPPELHVQLREARQQWSWPGPHRARLAGADVDGVRRDRMPTHVVEQAVVEHHLGSVVALLARLEDQCHPAGHRLATPHEESCGTEQAGHVEVVTACVHRAVGRGEGLAAAFGDRERVHVCAQQHRGAGFGALDHGHHRAATASEPDIQPERVELAAHY